MNLLFFSAADRPTSSASAADHRLQHLLQVLGARAGDQLRVGELGGLTGSGQVLAIDQQQAVLAVTLDRAPPPNRPCAWR